MILRSSRILGAGPEPVDGWVRLEGNRIAEVGPGQPPAPEVVHLPGVLVPGFVDQHVHGGGGASFQSGDQDEAAQAAAWHRRHGTTTMLASLVTAPVADLAETVARLADVVSEGLVAGVHLEGPFLSTAQCGAHDPSLLRDPEATDLDRLLTAGPVSMITLAPEREHGIEAVRRVAGAGAIAAVGHTDASFEVVLDAIEAGATVATHLFNGMRALHHREPGPVLALLEDPRVTLEVINDGVHVHPQLVAALHRGAPGRVALITDAVPPAGLPDGDYVLGKLAVRVEGGVPRLTEGGSLAGSSLTMDAAVRNAVAAGVPLSDAVDAATRAPARAMGLDNEVGSIAAGLRADLVHLDDELRVVDVWARGVRQQ